MRTREQDKRIISYRRFNPNFHHMKMAMGNDEIRFIFLYGGSSSAKSFSAAQAFLLECVSKGYNTMVFRKVGSTIGDSIYKTFQEAAKSLHMEALFQFQENLIKCFNGSYIRFKGLDDSEKIKGLESYQYVFCEEISEFDESDLKQIRKRLRGRKGQKIVALFNPVSEDHWVKKKIFDVEILTEVSNHLHGKLKDSLTGKVLSREYSEVGKKWVNSSRSVYNPRKKEYETHNPDMVIIKSTYLNNFWVVGSPDGTYGFYDAQTIADFEKDKERDYAYYMVYALGEWGTVKTGGEFFHAFEPSIHKASCPYVGGLPVHVSVDNNVLPYISVSFWQIELGDTIAIRQFHEIAAEDPFNTVTKAGELAAKYLDDIGHDEVVYLHGDVSTKSGNTIDDDKRSFFDKFKEKIEESFKCEDKLPKINPSVPMSGEFINAVYSGYVKGVSISIDESCKISVNDYISVKKDVNGGILKQRIKDKITKQTYEKAGHLSDCKRYVVTDMLKDKFTAFSLRRKRNKTRENDMRYYDAGKTDLSGAGVQVEINPAINGQFVAVVSKIKEGKVYITDAILSDSVIDGLGLSAMIDRGARLQIECSQSYVTYVRSLRDYFDDVRGRPDFAHKKERVESHLSNIHDRFYFRSDYDKDEPYARFVESVLDYNDKDNIEAMNSLAALSERVLRSNR